MSRTKKIPTKKVKKEKPKKIKPTVRAEVKKAAPPKIEKPKIEVKSKPARYFEAVGRRKTAIARIRLFTQGEKEFLINNKPYQNYFIIPELQQIIKSALEKMNCLDRFRILAMVKGGGLKAQAEAIRHGISRALVLFNPDFRKRLKKAGYLTRDARMRERKKFGLKRARKAPQWSKR